MDRDEETEMLRRFARQLFGSDATITPHDIEIARGIWRMYCEETLAGEAA